MTGLRRRARDAWLRNAGDIWCPTCGWFGRKAQRAQRAAQEADLVAWAAGLLETGPNIGVEAPWPGT